MREKRINAVLKLVDCVKKAGLIEEEEQIWAVSTLLDTFGLDTLTELPVAKNAILPEILDTLFNDACARGMLKENTTTYRDLFDTGLMERFALCPAEVRRKFEALYRRSPKAATDWYYKFSDDTNYTHRDRCAKDLRQTTKTAHGTLDISIDLPKPGRDPKNITTARSLLASNYLRCLLCVKNESHVGRVNHPTRQNLQVVSIAINEESWFLQYSPYIYYNEHCICFNREHTPMKIDRDTFARLLDFVRQFPYYFVGSNADLPIVGGSILAHNHLQGGRYSFTIERAEIEIAFRFPGFNDVGAGIVE